LTAATLLVALTFVPACKKAAPTETPDTAVAEPVDADDEQPDEPDQAALPAQDPDPAEIAALYDRYLKGDYEAVAQEAEALSAGLTADTQVRALALALAIQALAAVQGVPEDGHAAAEQAVSAADRLGDPEVQQLAYTAHGAYLVRVHEAERGQGELETALGFAGPYLALANLMLGEAHLNQAFGLGDEDMKIMNPGRLDDSRTAYQAAVDASDGLVQAHAHGGLAVVAKYKNDKPAICVHAQQAEDIYVAGGAVDYVREIPSMLAKDGRCKDFKKAK